MNQPSASSSSSLLFSYLFMFMCLLFTTSHFDSALGFYWCLCVCASALWLLDDGLLTIWRFHSKKKKKKNRKFYLSYLLPLLLVEHYVYHFLQCIEIDLCVCVRACFCACVLFTQKCHSYCLMCNHLHVIINIFFFFFENE